MGGGLDSDRGLEALDDLADLPLNGYPHDLLLPETWELRRSLTTYDAAYAALARVLAAHLVTREAALDSVGMYQARVGLL